MDRSVSVLRSKKTGNYILHPFGTFRGYGAYVGINPYREVPGDASSKALGQAIVDLLELSGPTGFGIDERDEYVRPTEDEETIRIREAYGLEDGMTTSKVAQRFLHAHVEQRTRQKSWVVQTYTYSSRWRSLSGSEHEPTRVKHSEGPAALGRVLQEVLALE
jgi:hypothetical protein